MLRCAFAETIAKLQGSVAEEEGELLKKSPPCVNESQKKLANIGGGKKPAKSPSVADESGDH